MTKRQTKAEQKRQEEIAAIERELRLMSIGACGSENVEPDDGCDLFQIMDHSRFSRWLSAIERYWGIDQREQESKFMMRPYNLDEWAKSYTSAAEFLHRNGAREGGEWL